MLALALYSLSSELRDGLMRGGSERGEGMGGLCAGVEACAGRRTRSQQYVRASSRRASEMEEDDLPSRSSPPNLLDPAAERAHLPSLLSTTDELHCESPKHC